MNLLQKKHHHHHQARKIQNQKFQEKFRKKTTVIHL